LDSASENEHPRQHRLGQRGERRDVQLDHLHLVLQVRLREGAVAGVARVVDEHVHLDALGLQPLHEPAGGGRLGQVGGHHQRPDAVLRGQLAGERLELGLGASHQHHVIATGGEQPGEVQADDPRSVREALPDSCQGVNVR
jgi:hypothetical protein